MTHSHSPEFPQDLGVYDRALPIPGLGESYQDAFHQVGFGDDRDEVTRHLTLVPSPNDQLEPKNKTYNVPTPFDQAPAAETSSGLPDLASLEKYFEYTGKGLVVANKYEILGNLRKEKAKADNLREGALLEQATEAVVGLADGIGATSKEEGDEVGFGVYRARDISTDELVTIKIGAEHGYYKDLSTVELEILKTLKNEDKTHPNISNLLDSGYSFTPDGQLFEFSVSEYAKDGTLADLKDLNTDELIEVSRQLTSAVTWLNSLGIVNLDLSLNNVGVTRNEAGEIKTKIIELESARPEENDVNNFNFGVSKKLEQATQRLAGIGFIIATPHYVSPEVRNPETATQDQTMSKKIDSYALSVLLEKLIINFHDSKKFGEIPKELIKIVGETIEEEDPEKRSSTEDIRTRVTELALVS